MTETQQSICTWADATFGPPVSDASIAARALVEMAELVTACVNGEPAERIGEEIADIVIVLARLGRSAGMDVVERIRKGDGPRHAADPLGYAGRAVETLGLTITALGVGGSSRLSAAVFSLVRLACRLDIDLPSAIDAKMAINRTRRWTLDGHGHGSHVKE